MEDVRRLRIAARRRVTDLFAGEYHSAFKGRGIEFAEVREYEPGDDVRSIDWNVTARAGKPFIKRFEEERQLTVAIAVDLSASGLFGTTRRTKGRLIAEVAAVVAMTALDNNDRVALLLFSDDTELYLPPKKGPNHLLRVIRELLDAKPHGGGKGLPAALDDLGRVLNQRSIVFLASDFSGGGWAESAPATERAIQLLHRRHEVIALRAQDPGERDLPPLGLIEVVDPETGERTIVDASSRRVRNTLRRIADAEHDQTTQMLRRAGCDLVDLSTDRPFMDDLARYFRLRERRRARE